MIVVLCFTVYIRIVLYSTSDSVIECILVLKSFFFVDGMSYVCQIK